MTNTDNSVPFISICIPTWNRAAFLEKALNSIINQDMTNQIELIITDNASNDETEHIATFYAKKYGYIKYNRNKTNLGFDKNVLSCMKLASGKYIHFLADEDVYLDNGLPEIIKSLKKRDVACAFINYYEYYSSTKTRSPPCRPVEKDILFQDKDSFLKFISIQSVWISGIILDREECLRSSPQQFVGTTFIHWCTLMRVLANREEALFIARPSVESVITPTPARYNMIAEMILLDNLISSMCNWGYRSLSINKARLDVFKAILKTVISQKIRLSSHAYSIYTKNLKLYKFPLLPLLILIRLIPAQPMIQIRNTNLYAKFFQKKYNNL